MRIGELKELLYGRYIAPTEIPGKNYIGIEIEMPVVSLAGEATSHTAAKKAMLAFQEHFSFAPADKDVHGFPFSATDETTGDNISFDCSYNNLELSFGRERDLNAVWERFQTYIRYLNAELSKEDHIVTGLGINPNCRINRKDYLPVPRYQMLEGFLNRSRDWIVPMYFHPYPDFGCFASASQVQLDVKKEDLIDTIRAFSMLEPLKAVLFHNSRMQAEPEYLCMRDLFWENSTHGINPHNIGMFERIPSSIDELLEYFARTSMFCAERDGHYLHFKPVPALDYFNSERIEAEYYWEGVYTPQEFVPKKEDLKYLRTYKFVDPTYRGTIEYRSCYAQPFKDAMTVAAFHLGLSGKLPELLALLRSDGTLYGYGYSEAELRRFLNRRAWPDFIDRDALRQLLLNVLSLAEAGLLDRGKGEEKFLAPLYDRAEKLESPARRMADGLDAGKSVLDFVREYAELL